MSASLLTIGVAVILWACQKEKYPNEELSAAIASSSEMEQYIISGYELQIALNEWEKAMDAIDWSKLSYVIDNDGREVAHLPVSSLVLETKLDQFNNCKSALQRKYPQVKAMSIEKCYDIVRTCVQQSETISTKLLDMGVNIYQPQTKPYIPDDYEIYDSSWGFLGTWVKDTNRVEAMRIGFADGHSLTYVNAGNTIDSCFVPTSYLNGNRYFPNYMNSPIRSLIHTHNDNMIPRPSDLDSSGKFNDVHNIEYGIFWRDSVYRY